MVKSLVLQNVKASCLDKSTLESLLKTYMEMTPTEKIKELEKFKYIPIHKLSGPLFNNLINIELTSFLDKEDKCIKDMEKFVPIHETKYNFYIDNTKNFDWLFKEYENFEFDKMFILSQLDVIKKDPKDPKYFTNLLDIIKRYVVEPKENPKSWQNLEKLSKQNRLTLTLGEVLDCLKSIHIFEMQIIGI